MSERLVTVFQGNGISAESEAQAIHGLLASSGIASLVVRENVPEIPVGSVEIKVVESLSQRALEVIQAGREGGPEAAEAAEAESEI
jgi:hypothetical protein